MQVKNRPCSKIVREAASAGGFDQKAPTPGSTRTPPFHEVNGSQISAPRQCRGSERPITALDGKQHLLRADSGQGCPERPASRTVAAVRPTAAIIRPKIQTETRPRIHYRPNRPSTPIGYRQIFHGASRAAEGQSSRSGGVFTIPRLGSEAVAIGMVLEVRLESRFAQSA